MNNPAENDGPDAMKNLTTNFSALYQDEQANFHIPENMSTANTNDNAGDMRTDNDVIDLNVPLENRELVDAVDSNTVTIGDSLSGSSVMNPILLEDEDDPNNAATVFNNLQRPRNELSLSAIRDDLIAIFGDRRQTAISHANDSTCATRFQATEQEGWSTTRSHNCGHMSAGVQPNREGGAVMGSSPRVCDTAANGGNFTSATESNIVQNQSVNRSSVTASNSPANEIQPVSQVGTLTATPNIVNAAVNNDNVVSASTLHNNFQRPQINRPSTSFAHSQASGVQPNIPNYAATNSDLRPNAFSFNRNNWPGTTRNVPNRGGTMPGYQQQMVFDNTMTNGVRTDSPFHPFSYGFDGNFVPNNPYALHVPQAHGSIPNIGGNMWGHASNSGNLIPYNANAGNIQVPQGNAQNYSCWPNLWHPGNSDWRHGNINPYSGMRGFPRAASRPLSVNQGSLQVHEQIRLPGVAIRPSTALGNSNVSGYSNIPQGYVNNLRGTSARPSVMSFSHGRGVGRTTGRDQSGAQNSSRGRPSPQASNIPRPTGGSARVQPPTTPPKRKRKMGSPPPTVHIKWKGFEEPCHSVQENCHICKRNLTFTPQGPVSQPSIPPTVAVLPCGHTFHDECLRLIIPQGQEKDPPCIPCAMGTSP